MALLKRRVCRNHFTKWPGAVTGAATLRVINPTWPQWPAPREQGHWGVYGVDESACRVDSGDNPPTDMEAAFMRGILRGMLKLLVTEALTRLFGPFFCPEGSLTQSLVEPYPMIHGRWAVAWHTPNGGRSRAMCGSQFSRPVRSGHSGAEHGSAS